MENKILHKYSIFEVKLHLAELEKEHGKEAVGEGQLIFDDDMMYPVVEGWLVGFTDNTELVPDEFPEPVLQMEIAFQRVPWVLDIENPYTLENMKKESEAMLKAKEQE